MLTRHVRLVDQYDGILIMTLREEIHQSIDELDNGALAVIREQIKLLKIAPPPPPETKRVPTIQEVLEMTASDKSSWSDDIIAAREDRV